MNEETIAEKQKNIREYTDNLMDAYLGHHDKIFVDSLEKLSFEIGKILGELSLLRDAKGKQCPVCYIRLNQFNDLIYAVKGENKHNED